jgi:Ca2+/Na+ antiporter
MPLKLAALVQRFLNKFEVGGAAVIRLFLAGMLWLCAPVSHTPAAFKVLAVIILATAIILLIIGRARLQKLIDWVTTWPPIAIRLQCLIGVAFGAFLLWSVSPGLSTV